ncbi:MAG: Wzz/FepE/Etk N-terminal domain-containing protein [bacterium]
MEEINLGDLLSYFKKKIGAIIIITILTFIAGCTYVFLLKTPVYTSSTTLILATDESESITSSDITLNNSLVGTYGEIVKSKKILYAVISELNLTESYEDLVGFVNVENISSTSIMKISVTHPDGKLASAISNEIADVFAAEVVDIFSIENLSIIDYAEENKVPSNNNGIMQIILSLFLGIFISCGLEFMFYYFDKRIKTREEVERITEWSVLTVIPMNQTEKN